MYCPHMAWICWRSNACQQRVHLWNPSQENRKVTVDKKSHARTVAATTWSGKQRESSWSNWLTRDKSCYWMVWETCVENWIKLGSLANNQEAAFKKHPRVTSLSEALLKPASDAQRCRTALHQQKQIGMDAISKLSRLLSKSEFTLCEEITNDSWIRLTILLNLVCFEVHVLLIGVARVWSARRVTSVEYHGIGLSNLPVERSFGEVRTVRHLDWTRSGLRLLEFLMWSHSPFTGVEPNPT